MPTKFAKNIRIKPGALHGWHEDQTTDVRHSHLVQAAARDGWAEVSRRLNFISNVANRSNNLKLHRIARADQRWAAERESETLRRERVRHEAGMGLAERRRRAYGSRTYSLRRE